MIYLVMGMGKSGTSMVAEMLHRSGIEMVDEQRSSMSYEEGRRYERASTLDINYELLNCRNVYSLNIDLKAPLADTPSLREKAAQIVEAGVRQDDWGFKDPRSTLTYDFWHEVLPEEHCLIIMYRHPVEVWMRYSKNNPLTSRVRKASRVLVHWIEYYSRTLQYIEHEDTEWMILQFEELLRRDCEVNRLSRFIGRKVVDVRDLSKRSHERSWLDKLLFEISVGISGMWEEKHECLSILSRLNELRRAQ